MRAAGAILVANAGQIRRWPRAPERGDVRGFAAARSAEVRVDGLAAIVGEHLALSRANRGNHRWAAVAVDEALAMCRGAEVVAILSMPSVILESVSANRNCQSLQSLGFRFRCAFGAHHAEHVIFEREFLRDVLSNQMDLNCGLRIADCGIRRLLF